jgi:hypothetical protein
MNLLLQSFGVGIWIGLAIFAVFLIWLGVSLGSMQKKFIKLGTLKGLTAEQITAAVGKGPKVIQYVEDGSIRVWAAIGYQITLLFDKDGLCIGVSNESTI